MLKSLAILQSNYIPWKGYFDLINSVDEFIIYDHVQYTKNDWRNRNIIKTANGLKWLTIPVIHSTSMIIKDVRVLNNRWRIKHWSTLSMNYCKARYFKDFKDQFEYLYLKGKETYLSEINYLFINAINGILKIKTKISKSWDYELEGDRTERLVGLIKQADANIYISGPAAKDYLEEDKFKKEGIKIIWMDYSNYPEYVQLYPPFQNNVSILDLIFNEGLDAVKYMKSFKNEKQ